MGDGVYMDCEITDNDVELIKNGIIPTRDKNKAEKIIQQAEKLTEKPLSEKRKEIIRKRYKYIGD